MKQPSSIKIVLPVTLDAGGEQYKPVRLEVQPGLLFVEVSVPTSEVVANTKAKVVLTPKGVALCGEALRKATLDAALERSGG